MSFPLLPRVVAGVAAGVLFAMLAVPVAFAVQPTEGTTDWPATPDFVSKRVEFVCATAHDSSRARTEEPAGCLSTSRPAPPAEPRR